MTCQTEGWWNFATVRSSIKIPNHWYGIYCVWSGWHNKNACRTILFVTSNPTTVYTPCLHLEQLVLNTEKSRIYMVTNRTYKLYIVMDELLKATRNQGSFATYVLFLCFQYDIWMCYVILYRLEHLNTKYVHISRT